MAISAELKKVLKDLKVGDESVLSIVNALDDKAEAKDKVQKANDDLVSQREAWEKEKKELKQSVTEFEKKMSTLEKEDKLKNEKISVLEKEKLSPEDREKLSQANDIMAELNRVREDAKKNAEEIKAERELRLATEKASRELKIESAKQNQRTILSNELSKYKITGIKNSQALNSIFGDGLAKLDIKEDGSTEEKYYTMSSDGKLMSADMVSLAKEFAESNLHFVDGSEVSGLGQTHNRSTDTTQSFANLSDERSAAENLMNL